MTNPNTPLLFTGSAATWVDTVAPSAFEALANAETGVSFGASISSTRLLPMYSGCFGPMAKDDGTDHSDAESINGDIDNNEKFQGLVDFLGYIWMGEDHRLNELDAAAGTGDSWFVRLAQLLGNLMQSAQQIPIRVLQTVRQNTARRYFYCYYRYYFYSFEYPMHTVGTRTNNTSKLFFSLCWRILYYDRYLPWFNTKQIENIYLGIVGVNFAWRSIRTPACLAKSWPAVK